MPILNSLHYRKLIMKNRLAKKLGNSGWSKLKYVRYYLPLYVEHKSGKPIKELTVLEYIHSLDNKPINDGNSKLEHVKETIEFYDVHKDEIKKLFGPLTCGKTKSNKERKKSAKDFYESDVWLKLRKLVLDKYGKVCMKCGKTSLQAEMHVDHIKHRSKYPKLELEFDNLQVLCRRCNINKSNIDETDWRTH